MLNFKKSLWIKYKLHQSVFESINDLAYSTQTRPLGTSKTSVNRIISHPTLCDLLLPNIIGLNRNSNDWEREKLDYISNLLIRVPRAGLKLNLDYHFSIDDNARKEYINKYIKDYNLYDEVEKSKTIKSEKEILEHILQNKDIDVIDYCMYFTYDNIEHYLFWTLAITSSQVANTPEDVEKSSNIRFFLYDEKKAEKREMTNLNLEVKAITKLSEMKTGASKALLEDIALLLRVVEYEDIKDLANAEEVIEYCYIKLFAHCKINPQSFLDNVEDKDLKIKAKIKRYIETALITSDDDGALTNSLNNKTIGINLSQSVDWFKNPINEAEVNKLETKFKSKK